MAVDLSRLDCVHCHEDGAVTLGGAVLAHFGRLDALFASWALQHGGAQLRFPDHVPIATMQRIGYLASFPHLATFMAPLSRDSTHGARSFATSNPRPVEAAALESPASMLAPSACFHAYPRLQDQDLPSACVLTMRGTCYRHEREYTPMRRQHAFAMRELVCIGSAAEVEAFVQHMANRIRAWLVALDWAMDWEPATDPFFDPQADPKRLAQHLGGLKTEVRYGDLAVCSLNLHGTFFGEAFSIRREGRTAHSACVAFGLERWLYAFAARFGEDASGWPVPEAQT